MKSGMGELEEGTRFYNMTICSFNLCLTASKFYD